jgi:hypothetical protein
LRHGEVFNRNSRLRPLREQIGCETLVSSGGID